MSIKCMNAVWRSSQAKESSLLLLLAIADFADDQGVAYPGIETLAKKARVDPRHAKRLVKKLCALQELTVERGRGPHGTNLYQVTICQGDNMSPSDICNQNGVTFDAKTSVKMSPNPSEETVRREPPTLRAEADARFEEFWKGVPARNGKKLYKAKTKENFLQLTVEEQGHAIAAAKAYATHCRHHEEKAKDPHRFLKGQDGELWRDFIPAEPSQAPTRLPVAQTEPTLPFTPTQQQVDSAKRLVRAGFKIPVEITEGTEVHTPAQSQEPALKDGPKR